MNISDLVFDFIDTVAFMVQDPEIWDNSNPISLPRDIFNGKSFRNIWIDFKVGHVDTEAFLSSYQTIESLYISAPGWVTAVNTIKM